MNLKRVKYSEVKDRLHILNQAHAQEISTLVFGEDGGLNINYALYEEMEKLNKHILFVAEVDSEIVGYLSVFVYNHPHHTHLLCGYTDAFFIDKDKRSIKTLNIIKQMFRETESILKNEYGVKYFFMSANGHKQLQLLATIMKFDICDVTYLKRLD